MRVPVFNGEQAVIRYSLMEPTPDTQEDQWLRDLRLGDATALRHIFDHHYPLLLGDIYRYIPDEDTCKDLAQEVFVEIWRKKSDLRIHTSLRAYLRRAAINRALNYIKVNRRTVLEDSSAWPESTDVSQAEIQGKSDQEKMEAALHLAIEQLPEKCRLVFSLSRFENLSHREISDRLGISVKTIENQITKAMRLLREAMLKYSDLSPAIILMLKWWWGG